MTFPSLLLLVHGRKTLEIFTYYFYSLLCSFVPCCAGHSNEVEGKRTKKTKKHFLWHFSGFTRSRDFGNCRLLEQTRQTVLNTQIVCRLWCCYQRDDIWIAKRGNGKWRSRERNVIKHRRKKRKKSRQTWECQAIIWVMDANWDGWVPSAKFEHNNKLPFFRASTQCELCCEVKVNERNQIT